MRISHGDSKSHSMMNGRVQIATVHDLGGRASTCFAVSTDWQSLWMSGKSLHDIMTRTQGCSTTRAKHARSGALSAMQEHRRCAICTASQPLQDWHVRTVSACATSAASPSDSPAHCRSLCCMYEQHNSSWAARDSQGQERARAAVGRAPPGGVRRQLTSPAYLRRNSASNACSVVCRSAATLCKWATRQLDASARDIDQCLMQ